MVSCSHQSVSRPRPDLNSLRRRHSNGHTWDDPSWQADADFKTGTYLVADGYYHGLSGINETNIHRRSITKLSCYRVAD